EKRRRDVHDGFKVFFLSLRSLGSAQLEPVLSKSGFYLDLWLVFTVQSWTLDVAELADELVLDRPGPAEFLHIVFNITTPLILLKMLQRSPRTPPPTALHLGTVVFVMASGVRLVADSIIRWLLLIGYQLHLSVRENPVLKNLQPSSLVEALELLFFFDDVLGHLMWYVPLFLVLLLFFSGCFCPRRPEARMPPAAWMLLVPNAAYYWYIITEGQTFILFIFTFFAMAATVMHQRRRDLVPDGNGLFMLYSFSAALVLVAVWVACLWGDPVLRRKHPGLIYVPQPRAFYSLHLGH
uniref:Ceroid-lipofuscinosis neuronal protein 6 homolog n=1 Tax=Echeneis naucrates TaxID=173247 RepID=A0A665VS29_ECHNA